MHSSWCPRSLTIKLVKWKCELGILKYYSICLLRKWPEILTCVSHTFPEGRTNLFFCVGTPWQDPDSNLPLKMRQLECSLFFLDCRTQSTIHGLSSLSRLIFSHQKVNSCIHNLFLCLNKYVRRIVRVHDWSRCDWRIAPDGRHFFRRPSCLGYRRSSPCQIRPGSFTPPETTILDSSIITSDLYKIGRGHETPRLSPRSP